jgi:membrane-associated phospholipid phosphatase
MGQLASRRTFEILATGGALAGACALVENHQEGTDAPEGHWWDTSSDVGNAAGDAATIAAAAGAALVIGHFASPSLYLTGSEMARSLIYSGIATVALKAAVQRTRPNGQPYSFPSGHSAAVFSIAPVLGARYGPYVAIPAYMLAGVTACGRVEERAHYPSDVVFGAALGLASGIAVARSDASVPGLSIVVQPAGIGLATRF